MMKQYLPGRPQLVVFVLIAVACAAIAWSSSAQDTAMSLLAFPIFTFSAILGLWKSGRLRATDD